MHYLTSDDIVAVHNALAETFSETNDPIYPAGVRSDALLESAASRQEAGFGSYIRNESIESTAATLVYGIICNHPFYNGNKRTALVSLLLFLDRNSRRLGRTEEVPRRPMTQNLHKELYELVTRVASHTICGGKRAHSDSEVAAVGTWIRYNSRTSQSGEHPITYRQLRQVIGKFGYEMQNPKGNTIEVVRLSSQRVPLLPFERTIRQRHRIPYPGENALISKQTMREMRARLGLSENEGYDSNAFYDDRTVVDVYITAYHGLLRRLAKT